MHRCAVIGDVHAEDERLEVALRAAVPLRVDTIACTGDVVDGRGSVERCCRLLREYNVCCVRGNHDRWVFTGLLRDSAGVTQWHDLAGRPTGAAWITPLTIEVTVRAVRRCV